MNKTEVISKVSQQSGAAAEICEKLLDAFEEQSSEALVNKFKGVKNNRADMVAGMAEKTGVAADICEKVLAAFEEVFAGGLSDKLKIFK